MLRRGNPRIFRNGPAPLSSVMVMKSTDEPFITWANMFSERQKDSPGAVFLSFTKRLGRAIFHYRSFFSILAQESLSVAVLLNTGAPGSLSSSTLK